MTKWKSYPIPRIEKCIDSLGEGGIYLSVVANSGYWQDKIGAANHNKSPFASCHGLFWLIFIPFGLHNVPGISQPTKDAIFSAMRRQFALAQLVYIVILLKTPQEHSGHVCKVLTLPRNAAVTLKLKKCELFSETIDFLGHFTCPWRMEISFHATDTISGLKTRSGRAKVRSILRLGNDFKRIVSNIAQLVTALNQKLYKNQPTISGMLNKKELNSINFLKQTLISQSILVFPAAVDT